MSVSESITPRALMGATRSSRDTVAAALIALAVVGLVALLVAVTVGNSTGTAAPSTGRAAALIQSVPVVPHGYVRDPATHALPRVPDAAAASAQNAPSYREHS